MITLPWPDNRLSPNARIHWSKRREVVKAAREAAAWTVKAQMPLHARQAVAQGEEPIPVTISFIPPDHRRRDDDNMVASFKAARDGIADALGVDDRRFRPHYLFCQPEKVGKIEVRFG